LMERTNEQRLQQQSCCEGFGYAQLQGKTLRAQRVMAIPSINVKTSQYEPQVKYKNTYIKNLSHVFV
ncbi:hypothetical protein, partial [Klebsiella pneumoniae]|uniref:hypothetical protein n=1 Tax=Klebsiella pneumoniae TaxID=573 RepID=UPI003012F5F9